MEVRSESEVLQERESKGSAEGDLIHPEAAPPKVAERLGYRCRNCGTYSSPSERFCPSCEKAKIDLGPQAGNPFGDIFSGLMESMAGAAPFPTGKERVTTTRSRFGKEEVVVFERAGDMIRVLDEKSLERKRELDS